MSDGKSNCELDNERNIRDQKKKQEKNTSEKMRDLRSTYDSDMDKLKN
jgi:hypothetical protein